MQSVEQILVLATHNSGKLREFSALLAELQIQIVGIEGVLGTQFKVLEDGLTFEENARRKAEAVCQASGLISLADDSGLEVDALGGRPGVYSARYGGEHLSDAERNARLLRELAGVPAEERTARFRCVLALTDLRRIEGTVCVAGVCEGVISLAPSGMGGFGYDPIFVVSGIGRTLAELTLDEKNRVSHRHQAIEALKPLLVAWIKRVVPCDSLTPPQSAC